MLYLQTTDLSKKTTMACLQDLRQHLSPLPCYEEIRPLIYKNMDKEVKLILEHTLEHLKNKGQAIDEHTLEAYEYYNKLVRE